MDHSTNQSRGFTLDTSALVSSIIFWTLLCEDLDFLKCLHAGSNKRKKKKRINYSGDGAPLEVLKIQNGDRLSQRKSICVVTKSQYQLNGILSINHQSVNFPDLFFLAIILWCAFFSRTIFHFIILLSFFIFLIIIPPYSSVANCYHNSFHYIPSSSLILFLYIYFSLILLEDESIL